MSNEVTTGRSSALAALRSLKTGIANVRQRLPENTGSPFLRMGTDGEWVFGQDDNVVKVGTEAVLNPLSIRHGYTCWTNRGKAEGKNENLGEEMFRLSEAVPMAHELVQHKDPKTGAACPWKDQLSMDVKFMDGKHKGVQVLFKTSSMGGLNACRGIMDAMLERLDEDTDFVCPIISIDHDSYKHKSYGKTYVPKLEIIGWANLDGDEEGADEDQPKLAPAKAEPEPEPAPTRRTARAAAPEVADEAPAEVEDEPAAEDEAPPARRRRRA